MKHLEPKVTEEDKYEFMRYYSQEQINIAREALAGLGDLLTRRLDPEDWDEENDGLLSEADVLLNRGILSNAIFSVVDLSCHVREMRETFILHEVFEPLLIDICTADAMLSQMMMDLVKIEGDEQTIATPQIVNEPIRELIKVIKPFLDDLQTAHDEEYGVTVLGENCL